MGPRLPRRWRRNWDSAVGLYLPDGGRSQPDYGAMYRKLRENGNVF
jgi:hypothetical protein